jgi:hypothetical protein
MKDTTKMRSMEATIQTLCDARPFGNIGFDGCAMARTLAAATRATTTLEMMANPPVCGVGMECNVRSLGRDSIDKNDFGEHKQLVSHQATTKAKVPGKTTMMTDMVTPAPDWAVKLKGSVGIEDPTVLGASSMTHSHMEIKTNVTQELDR